MNNDIRAVRDIIYDGMYARLMMEKKGHLPKNGIPR